MLTNPPLRDMQFVPHEVFQAKVMTKAMPRHADVDADNSSTRRWRRKCLLPGHLPAETSVAIPRYRSTSRTH